MLYFQLQNPHIFWNQTQIESKGNIINPWNQFQHFSISNYLNLCDNLVNRYAVPPTNDADTSIVALWKNFFVWLIENSTKAWAGRRSVCVRVPGAHAVDLFETQRGILMNSISSQRNANCVWERGPLHGCVMSFCSKVFNKLKNFSHLARCWVRI